MLGSHRRPLLFIPVGPSRPQNRSNLRLEPRDATNLGRSRDRLFHDRMMLSIQIASGPLACDWQLTLT